MAVPIRAGIPGRWEGARCRTLRITGPDDDLPFNPDYQDLMLDVCNLPDPCPVRERCLLFALVNNCHIGVWGGMGPEDRAALRKTYPLGMGRRTVSGVVYDPPHQWKWLPPGEALLLLTSRQRRRIETGETDDGGKTCRQDERTG